MATTLLGNKNVEDIIKLNFSGKATEFIIVHKGVPSEIYDNSCDGIWIVMKDIYEKRALGNNNDYENSDIHNDLNNDILSLFDENIRKYIKAVKIPFRPGSGGASISVKKGADGLPCYIFLLSASEVNFSNKVKDGACLSYFSGIAEISKERRIGYYKDAATAYSLRTPDTTYSGRADLVITVDNVGNGGISSCGSANNGIRPALILDPSLLVSDDGFVSPNPPPEITANKSGDLGTLTDGFDVEYSVNDADGDTVTVTESLDSANVRSYEAVPDQTETYGLRDKEWLKTANGEHTFTISASDGNDTSVHSITFTRDQTSLSVTLEEPFTADDNIVACKLKVDGDIPDDAVCKYEVTNTALDGSPSWEDCTEETKAGRSHLFKGKGSAFNFRVSIERGSSGTGGYITEISGGYE